MKKLSLGKLIGVALVAGMIPYRARTDVETGTYEVDALLWKFKKTPDDENSRFTLEILPFMNSGGELTEPAEE